MPMGAVKVRSRYSAPFYMLWFGAHKPFDMFFHDPIEERDHSAGTKHSQECADMDSDDAVGKDERRNSRQDDAGDVNNVLRQAEF